MPTATRDAALPWTYRAPHRPASHPGQCYYGDTRGGRRKHCIRGQTADAGRLSLFRFADAAESQLTVWLPAGSLAIDINVEQLLALRNACNDALADIAEAEAERLRRESFEAIQEELREADAAGRPQTVMHMHPDVYYVPADRVETTVRELEAAGAERYIVLPLEPAGATA